MTIQFAPRAEADFRELTEYVAGSDPIAATRLGQRVFDMIDRLAASELEGPEQRLTIGEIVRSWSVPPVRIYYQRQADTLRVLRIYHQARDPIVR